MSSKFTNAVALALFAAAVPLNATAEMMSLTEYLASKPEPATSTNSAADENPFENLSFELPTAPSDAEPFPESGLQPNRIEMPPTPGSPARLPSVFVVVECGAAGDYVREIVCEPDTTVSRALKAQVYPQPIDFRNTEVAVHRASQQVNDDLAVEAEEEILRVEWDATTNEPTAKSNHRLQPSDRLIVTLPASTRAETPYPHAQEARRAVVYSALPVPVTSPYAVKATASVAPVAAVRPTAPRTNSAAAPPSTVKFDVIVVEDVGDSFAEFEELRSRMPFMLTDTSTIQGTLRILEKHNLVRRVSSPKLMVAAGEKATLAIGSETPNTDQPWQGIKAEMGARELGGGLVVDFSLANTEGRQTNKVQTSLIVPHGQTVIMKTGSQLLQASTDEDTAEGKVEHAVYVVLTPEIVK